MAGIASDPPGEAPGTPDETPPGFEAPPGFETPPGFEAPPGFGVRPRTAVLVFVGTVVAAALAAVLWWSTFPRSEPPDPPALDAEVDAGGAGSPG